jgi:type VI protein secretion system component VasF
MGPTELEKLCYPVFSCICNYWQLSCITDYIDKEKFQRDITGLLFQAKRIAEQDPRLAREYEWIEKPLVFFIDYMVKEGRFPFRQEWIELSRKYNELSGDEKFFDLLSQALNHPELHSSCVLFYIMLGLGFDGAYHYNHEYIKHCMQLCMEKSATDYDINSEPVIDIPLKKYSFKKQRKSTIRVTLIASAIFMVVCFIINLMVFINTTENYRKILKKTADDSVSQLNSTILLEGNK